MRKFYRHLCTVNGTKQFEIIYRTYQKVQTLLLKYKYYLLIKNVLN